MPQAHSQGLWKETSENGGAPVVAPVWLQFDGTDWVLVTSGSVDARMIPDGLGDYMLVDVRAASRAAIIADVGDYLLATSGTVVAQLIDDSADVLLSTDLVARTAADICPDAGGDLWVEPRDTSTDLHFIQITDTYLPY